MYVNYALKDKVGDILWFLTRAANVDLSPVSQQLITNALITLI